MELVPRPPRVEGYKYAVPRAFQPFLAHRGSPPMKPFCPKALGSPFVVSRHGKDLPRLPQVTRPAFSSSSRDKLSGRGQRGPMEGQEEGWREPGT